MTSQTSPMKRVTPNKMSSGFNGIQTIQCKTRKSWRHWLEKNHAKEKSVWLVMYNNKSETRGISQATAVEEALCFGWIDSKSVKRDDESRYQYFSPRKPKSTWSKINRERVDRLTREGLMAPAGQALIDLAKSSGTWEAFADVENGVIPNDLKKMFSRNKTAFINFQAFSPSSQRIILQWILMAKRPETRKQRIEKTVVFAARNLKAYP